MDPKMTLQPVISSVSCIPRFTQKLCNTRVSAFLSVKIRLKALRMLHDVGTGISKAPPPQKKQSTKTKHHHHHSRGNHISMRALKQGQKNVQLGPINDIKQLCGNISLHISVWLRLCVKVCTYGETC